MVLNIETVLNDFTAIVASVDSDEQLDILLRVQEIIDYRIEELQGNDKGQDGEERKSENN